MKPSDRLLSEFYTILQAKFGERIKEYLFPPPVFVAMKAELVDVDLVNGSHTARFPILESDLNPYGAM